MDTDFAAEYSKHNDDELLQLATQKRSLTPPAAAALDAELRRRNLTEADRVGHERFVHQQERREAHRSLARQRRWRPSYLKDQLTWVDLLWVLAALALILIVGLSLPSRYHVGPDWREATVIVTITSIVIAIFCRRFLWKEFTFWISLLMAAVVQLLAVHAYTMRFGELSRQGGKTAALLGFLVFFAVYGSFRFLRRTIYGKEAPGPAQ